MTSARAPITKAPMVTESVFLPTRAFLQIALPAAGEEVDDLAFSRMRQQLPGWTRSDGLFALPVQEDAVVRDLEDAVQLVSDQHHRGPQAAPELEDQLVQAVRAHGIQ